MASDVVLKLNARFRFGFCGQLDFKLQGLLEEMFFHTLAVGSAEDRKSVV